MVPEGVATTLPEGVAITIPKERTRPAPVGAAASRPVMRQRSVSSKQMALMRVCLPPASRGPREGPGWAHIGR